MLVSGIAAILLYLTGFAYLAATITRARPKRWIVLGLGLAAFVLHAVTSSQQIFVPEGFDFSLMRVSSIIFLTINLMVLLSSVHRPVFSLLLILQPLAALVLGISLLLDSSMEPWSTLPPAMGFHVIVSILAYSLLTLSVFQALLVGYQNIQLHHRHPGGLVRALPPLQTMEALLFEILWAGFLLLTLALVSGFLYHEDFFGRNVLHKAVFSMIGWVVYATLLWGHHARGWRGMTAIRWTVGGFAALALAYWGSKLVIEYILSG